MILFYVTFGTEESAKKMSDHLIGEKLVACSNISTMQSTYRWEGAIQNDDEWVGIFKTSYGNKDIVELTIEKLHPYEVPCILHWEFSCNLSYEKWLRSQIVERRPQ